MILKSFHKRKRLEHTCAGVLWLHTSLWILCAVSGDEHRFSVEVSLAQFWGWVFRLWVRWSCLMIPIRYESHAKNISGMNWSIIALCWTAIAGHQYRHTRMIKFCTVLHGGIDSVDMEHVCICTAVYWVFSQTWSKCHESFSILFCFYHCT